MRGAYCDPSVATIEQLIAAVDKAWAGDGTFTICLASGTYVLPLIQDRETHHLWLPEAPTMIGAGKGKTILQGQSLSAGVNQSVLRTESCFDPIRLIELSVAGGSGSSGGGIITGGWLERTDCEVSGNAANHGGAISNAHSANEPSRLVLTKRTVTGNPVTTETRRGKGGGVYNGVEVVVVDSDISGSSADDWRNCFHAEGSSVTGSCPA